MQGMILNGWRLGVWALAAAFVFGGVAGALEGPLSPEDSIAAMQHDPAVRVELVASEPLVFDPIALCFDAAGRMFVVENRGYPTDADPPRGDIVLLEDGDGDGVMDKRTIFAEGFDFPSGIMPWKEGLLVICSPEVLHLKDTDGDGRADSREVLLTGFSTGGSTQLRSSHPTLALDGWIYFTNGLSGGEVRVPSDPPEMAVKMGAMDLRWNPWDNRIETVGGQAQYGQAFDEFGNRFICSNRKHIEQVMLQPGDLARNPFLPQTQLTADIPDHGAAAKTFAVSSNVTTAYSHGGTFTAACGLVIYRGEALGTDFQGNAFVCDPTGNLVHRDILDYGGAACTARRAYEDREFLASTDNWFRPVFLANGPDGALYLCDMYRKTIEHPVYLPPEIAAKTDFASGRERGRIYRIVGAAAPPSPTLNIDSEVGLLDAVAGGAGWRAEVAFRLLLEQPQRVSAEALRERYLRVDETQRARLLRLRAARAELREDDLGQALASDNEALRIAALEIAATVSANVDHLSALLNAASPRVRFQAALAVGALADVASTKNASLGESLATCIMASTDDPWIVAAGLSAAGVDSEAFVRSAFALLRRAADRNDARQLDLTETVVRMSETSHSGVLVAPTLEEAKAALDPWCLRSLNALLAGRHPSGPEAGAAVFWQLRPEGVNDPGLVAIAETAKSIAVDTQAALGVRVAAVELLGHFGFDAVGRLLASALAPGTPDKIQQAAVGAIAATGDPRGGALLLEPGAWSGFSAGTRGVARAVVFSRAEWILQLLGGIEEGKISAYTLEPAARAQLMTSGDAAVSAMARRLFEALGGGDRAAVYEAQKDLLALTGMAGNGREVYLNTCAQCHVFQGEGHAVGPELSDIRAQTPEYILLHLIDPNKAVTAGFESYTVATTGLETHVGILAGENEGAITLRQALGAEVTIPRGEIASLTTENRSLMPDELEKSLTKQQIRDLIAFLKGE